MNETSREAVSLTPRTENAQRAYEEAWATDRRSVFDAAIRVIESEARAEAAQGALDEIDVARLAWAMAVDGYGANVEPSIYVKSAAMVLDIYRSDEPTPPHYVLAALQDRGADREDLKHG